MVGDWIEDLIDEGVDTATSRSGVRDITRWITDAIEWAVPGSRTTMPTDPALVVSAPNPLPGLLLLGAAVATLYYVGTFKTNPRITNRNRRRR